MQPISIRVKLVEVGSQACPVSGHRQIYGKENIGTIDQVLCGFLSNSWHSLVEFSRVRSLESEMRAKSTLALLCMRARLTEIRWCVCAEEQQTQLYKVFTMTLCCDFTRHYDHYIDFTICQNKSKSNINVLAKSSNMLPVLCFGVLVITSYNVLAWCNDVWQTN